MASSNRHWPSMFKSKPCNNHNNSHQWQLHDHNPNSLLSTDCHRPPYTSGPGCEERSPEPKPRWNPKPEQIRILEAIFNSGIVNPPRDEIRKIRAQLQEYGQVGDANVFYWFQNRKSRSKHKLRKQPAAATSSAPRPPPGPATSSSSSSSDKSSPKKYPMEMTNSPTASVNNNHPSFFQAPEFLGEPYVYPMGGFSFPSEVSGGGHVPPVDANMLLGELLMMNNTNANANANANANGNGNNHNHIGSTKKVDHDHHHEKVYNTSVDATSVSSDTSASVTTTTTTVPSTISHFLGIGLGDSNAMGPAKSTIFINDVAFEVNLGPFNVREAFGEDAMLIQSNGQPVFTNEWGVTYQSLQHGGFYYLVRTLAPVTVSEAHLI